MTRFLHVAVLVVGCLAFGQSTQTANLQPNLYAQKILVANRAGFDSSALIDEHLINPWGVALRPPGAGGHIWISNAGTLSTSTFIGDAHGIPLHQDGLKIVYLNGPLISYEDGLANVTGRVYNAASDFPGQPLEFPVAGHASDLSSGSAVPIGTIRNRLYVTDFQNSTIRVLNDQWVDITGSVPFARPTGMPAAFSPYNTQVLGGRLYVAFAALDANAEEPATDVPAPGTGHVVAYDVDGHIVQEFADAGRLNSPWGMAIAPRNFGPFGGALLIGNFGDGTIAAFDLATGAFRDYLRDQSGKPISIDGLWGLVFGNGVSLGDADSLYLTAGPNQEQDGVFGRVRYSGS